LSRCIICENSKQVFFGDIMDGNTKIKMSWFPDDELESDIESMPVHILVAEDDPSTRTLLVKALENNGYRVTAAKDGFQAWEALENEEDYPELAILDWMMPGLTGPQLCQKLRDRKYPFVFTILLTARTQNADIIEGLEAGAHEFLIKPFDLYVLSARVAAGARIVRLEKKLSIKSEILNDYAQKLEKLEKK